LSWFKKTVDEFPRKFWVVVLVSFVDKVGGTLLFPFFALYITRRFQVGMTQAGVILDNFNPNLLWFLGAGLCAASSLCYYFLHLRLGAQARFAPAELETVAD